VLGKWVKGVIVQLIKKKGIGSPKNSVKIPDTCSAEFEFECFAERA
jgi:hypothetical protein